MKVSIFTLTAKGLLLGEKLLEIYDDARLYTLDKFQSNKAIYYENTFKESVRESFYKSEILIFVCASGIAIRSLAPLIESKLSDPGVIVMDDNANNVISLLSGHIGGANYETLKVARFFHSNPVITIKASVDMIALNNNLLLKDFKMAKEITAKIINNEDLLVIDDYHESREDIRSLYDLHVIINKDNKKIETKDEKSYIIISNKERLNVKNTSLVQLYPKNIVIGIGCRRGTSSSHILKLIRDSLDKLNISINSIKHVATVDVKADEEGLIGACKILEIPLIIIPRSEILKVEDKYEGSDFVKEKIGVSSVSEPCCELSAGSGRFLIRKHKDNGATISIWEEKFNG